MNHVEEALSLVHTIINPENTGQVHEASNALQRIQLSEAGWQVGEALLNNDDVDGNVNTNLKFYGALTFQIKLNKEAHALDPDLAEEILGRLLSWVVRLASEGGKRLVLDKLCATLSTYFVQSPVRWERALRQLLCSLLIGRVAVMEELAGLPDTPLLIPQLSHEKRIVAVRFCQTLAEDMFNLASLSQRRAQLSETFKENTIDAVAIMLACFVEDAYKHTDAAVEALNCFSAWVTYGHNTWSGDPVTLGLLQLLTPKAAGYLLSTTDDLQDPAIELFVTILDYRIKFLKKEDLDLLSSLVRQTIGPRCVLACHRGQQEPEDIALSKLVAAYGRASVNVIVEHREYESSEEVVALFQQLITGPGYPGEDDVIILSATEFWTDYAEHIVDTIVDSESDGLESWLPAVSADLMRALQNYIPKIAQPGMDIMLTWDEDALALWKFLRDNVGDLLESIAAVPGINLLQELVTLLLHVLPAKDWQNLEAIVFCIVCIADGVNMTVEEDAIRAIMGSSIFSDISDFSTNAPVSLKRAVLKMIDGYASFIKSHPIYIPPVLTFLFTILERTPATEEKTADQAAKSFESLCSSCRHGLKQHLPELLLQCPRALSGPTANAYQKEKVMAALASIIQALSTEEEKAGPLLSLIEVIEGDLNTAVQAIQSGNQEYGELLGTTALQCLASIGKGIQAPDDVYIDLDSDEESGSKPTAPTASQTFWTAEAGAAVQARILACFQITAYLHNAGDAIDAACSVLRAGLAETESGPFVFPPSATVLFISKANITTSRIEAIISTACTFVSAYSRRNAPHLFEEVLEVYKTIGRVIAGLGNPSNDPQLAQLCVDFLQRLLTAYLDVLLAPSDEEVAGVLNFALICLTGEAPMLKRSVCGFFETLIGLARPNNPSPLPPTRVPITLLLTHFSPSIATALIGQIAGLAQRSEVDALCKPLRAFVFGIPSAKKYLEEALMDDKFESLAIDGRERRMFLAKVMSLRGNRQTNVVVKEFWATCKGTVSKFE